MKKAMLLVVVVALTMSACSGGVPVDKFSGIYPGMSCDDLNSYLRENKISHKVKDNEYKFELSGDAWDDAEVKCDKVVTEMEFESKEGIGPKYAQFYIDAQQTLLSVFRGNPISYEEGNKIINVNNGIKLHQFSDEKSGAITHFKISVDNVSGARAAWEIAVKDVMPKIGAKK